MIYKEKFKNSIVYISIFLFFCMLYLRIPLVHDAMASSGIYNNSDNFVDWLKASFALYNVLNGRTLATIIVGFLERNEFVLDISCAFILTAIIYLYQKCLPSNKIMTIFYALLALLAVPIGIRTEVYFYATMIYAVPVFIIFLFVLCLNKYLHNGQFETLKQYVFFVVLGYMNAAWIEHTSCAFIVVFAIFILYDSKKNRRINIKFWVAEGIFVLGFLLMMLSPGLRLQRDFALENKSTISLVIDNLNTLLNFLFIEHSGMFSLLSIGCILFTIHNRKRFKVLFIRNIYILTMLAWTVFLMKNFINHSMPWIPPEIRIPLIALFFIELLLPIIKSKHHVPLFFFYLTGLMSLAPVIITPNFSYRVCYYFFIMLNFVTITIWFESLPVIKKAEKGIAVFLMIPSLIVADAYCIVTYNIHNIQMEREELINEVVNLQHRGMWDYDDVLVLPRFSEQQLYAEGSPQKYYDRVHYQAFLNYYHLSADTLVFFGDTYDKLKVIDNADGTVILSAEPVQNNICYTYQFLMFNNKVQINQSAILDEANYQFVIPEDSGLYYFGCVLIDNAGNRTSVFSPKIFDIE